MLRILALTAAAGVVAAVVPAGAASVSPAPKPQITDPTGDANGINGQGAPVPVPSVSSPASYAPADIVSTLFQTTYTTTTTTKKVTTVVKGKKVTKTVTTTTQVPNGSTITMTLSAAPNTDLDYNVNFTSSNCSGTVYLDYSASPLGSDGGTCLTGVSGNPTITFPEAVVKDKTVVFTLPLSAFPVGTSFSTLDAQVLDPTDGIAIDDAAASDASFVVGK
jgi:hypothetical protein